MKEVGTRLKTMRIVWKEFKKTGLLKSIRQKQKKRSNNQLLNSWLFLLILLANVVMVFFTKEDRQSIDSLR